MHDFIAPALSALFGVLVGVAVQWWVASRTEFRILCDEFCRAIDDAVRISSENWMRAGNEPAVTLAEVQIVGLQQRIGGYNALMARRFSLVAKQSLDARLVALFDALSCDQFGDVDRPSRRDLAANVQAAGGEAVLAVRTAFTDTAGFRETVSRCWKRFKQIELDTSG